jgi:hypothetical protein
MTIAQWTAASIPERLHGDMNPLKTQFQLVLNMWLTIFAM